MSVQNSIDRLNAIKARIRTNLVAQGITVPEDTVLEEMAEQILSVAGEDGHTPVKGVDYFTDAEKAAMVSEAAAATESAVNTAYDKAATAETTATTAQTTANEAKTAAATAQATADTKAPAYTYGTADMTAGSSALETGKLYFVYE